MKLGTYRLLLGRPSGRHGWWPRLLAGAMLLALLQWAARGAQVSFGELFKGLPWIGDFIARH